MIKEILDSANRLGACNKTENIKDWEALASLFFSPQGREFCERHNYPSIEIFRKMKPFLNDNISVYIDAGFIRRDNEKNIAIIGDTAGYLTFDDNSVVHKIILMHGARAVIKAKNYAVLLIANIGECNVEINKDATVRIL